MKGGAGACIPRASLSVVQDRWILHYGDLAIAIYRGGCRAGSPDPARISVGQDRLILTCSGAGAPELQSGKSARS